MARKGIRGLAEETYTIRCGDTEVREKKEAAIPQAMAASVASK